MPKGSTRRDKGKGRAVNVSVPEEPQHEHQVEDGAHEHSEPSNVAEPSMDKDSALASLDNPSTETEEQPDKNSHNEMADKTNDELDTLKKVQDAINVSHPFGIKIWKPALYKKSRSVNRNIDELLHAKPGVVETRTLYLHPGNLLWAITFGWWIAVLYAFVAIFLLGPWFLLGKLMSLFSCSSSAQTSTFSTSARHIQVFVFEYSRAFSHAADIIA